MLGSTLRSCSEVASGELWGAERVTFEEGDHGKEA